MKKYSMLFVVLIAICVAGFFVYRYSLKQSIEHGKHIFGTDSINRNDLPNYISEDITSLAYASKIDLEQTGVAVIDNRIKSDVLSKVSAFVADARVGYEQNPDSYVNDGVKWNTSWVGRVGSRAGSIINYRLNGYDYTGGAHGTPVSIRYVIDTTDPSYTPLTITDVFNPGTDYLQRLSELSRELLVLGRVEPHELAIAIAEQPDMAFNMRDISQGTNPDIDNFATFELDHPGIRIIFGVYQVGPYVIGQPEIIIPWDRVKDIVDVELMGRVHSE